LEAFDRTIDTETLQETASKDITGMVSTKTDVRRARDVLSSCVTRWEEAARTGGQYTKIGRQVTIRGVFRVSSVTSAGTGDATITGVPFVPSNVAPSWTRTPGSLIQQNGATLATNSLFVGFDTTGSATLTMSTQSTSTIAAISVTDADFVDSIYSFTFTYFV
jgi:hypothetical protein